MTTPPTERGYKVWPQDRPVAVVMTFQLLIDKYAPEHAAVREQMWTAFEGEGAGLRAHAFKDSEEDRDFTAADGWYWTIWMNKPAREELGDWRTKQLLGEEHQ